MDESKPKNAYNVGLGQTNIESQTQPITGNHFLLLYDRIANSNQQLANNNERMAQKLAEEETKKEQFKIQTAKEIFNTNLAEFKECEKNMKECFKPSNTLYQECKNPPCDLEFKKTLLLKSQDNVDFLLKQSSFDNKKI